MNFGSQCSWWVWLAFGHASSLRLGSQWESVSASVGTQSPETNSVLELLFMPPCFIISFRNHLHSFVLWCEQRITSSFLSLFISMNKFRWTLMFLRFICFSRGSLFISVERRLTFPHFRLSVAVETRAHYWLLHCSLINWDVFFFTLYVTQVWILFDTLIPPWLCVCVSFCYLSEQHLMDMFMYMQKIIDKCLWLIWVGLCFSLCKLLYVRFSFTYIKTCVR